MNWMLKLLRGIQGGEEGTYVYIDGMNLYSRVLMGSDCKWLDLDAMCEALLERHKILKIKYFTARVLNTRKNPRRSKRQDVYLQALAGCQPKVEVILGNFVERRLLGPLVAQWRPDASEIIGFLQRDVNKKLEYRRLSDSDIFAINKFEEKRTDVNLAAHLLNDCWRNVYDRAVVISNDSDISAAMEFVRSHPKQIGLIPPVSRKNRKLISNALLEQADFVKLIHPDILRRSQLPDIIPGTNIQKPKEW